MTHATLGTLTFQIMGFDQAVLNDTSLTHSMTLFQKNVIGPMIFDNGEYTNATYEIRNYGENRWDQANLRQWLNSENVANAWYTAQNDTDEPPPYKNLDGFLYGFPADFKSVLAQVKNTTTLGAHNGRWNN